MTSKRKRKPPNRGGKHGGHNKIELAEGDYSRVAKMAKYLPDRLIADVVGVSENTFVALKQRDERLAAALKKGRSQGAQAVGKSLYAAAVSGNIAAMIFYAKCRMDYRETLKVETNQAPQSEEKRRLLSELTDDQVRRIADIARERGGKGGLAAGPGEGAGRAAPRGLH